MTRATQGKIVKGAAIALDVGAPLIATLTQFPVWVNKSSEATVSGLFLMLALVSVIPFFRQIKEYIKSPAVWVLWTVVFGMMIVLRSILDEIIIVCFVGMVANILGAGIYNVGKIIGGEEKKDK